jgi:hypothetical protein
METEESAAAVKIDEASP